MMNRNRRRGPAGILLGMLILAFFGCEATHDNAIIYTRDEVTLDQNEQVKRYLASGDSYLKSEIWDEAEGAYRKVLRVDPGNRTANINLAYVYRKTGRDDLAFRLDEQFTKSSPDAPDGHARYAAALAGRDNVGGAITSIERAIELKGDEVSYWSDLGYYALQVEDYDKGLEAYNGVLALDPENQVAQQQRVRCLKETGQLDVIFEDEENRLAEDPENRKLLRSVAKMRREADDFSGAAELYDRLATLDKDNVSVLKNLALCYLQVPDTSSALSSYERVIELDDSDVNTIVRVAELQATKSVGRFNEAITNVKTALDLDKENARGWCVWGKALEYKGEYEQAISKFNQASALEDPVWSPYAQSEITRQNQLIERRKKLQEQKEYEETEVYN